MSKSRITLSYLENAALFYLERFASSSANLRRILLRRVERIARQDGDDPADGVVLVDALIARYLAAGLLDDGQYAAMTAGRLHRQGASLRAIRQHLSSKGISSDLVDSTLDDLTHSTGDADLEAARAYARRRRLGPWREPEKRLLQRNRDLAALGRAGFSWGIAQAVIDGERD